MNKLILMLLLLACATPETPYKKMNNGLGFLVKEGNPWNESVFKGNSRTRSDVASAYAGLAAIEFCKSKNKVTFISETVDRSQRETFNQVSSSIDFVHNPFGWHGNDFFYDDFYFRNRFRRNRFRHRFGYRNPYGFNLFVPMRTYYSRPVYIQFPEFVSKFKCVDSYYQLSSKLTLEKISKELVHTFAKDFKGGLLVKKSDGADLKTWDLILSVNNKRIESEEELYSEALSDNKGNLSAKILRNQSIQNISINSKDVTAKLKEVNQGIISTTCDRIKRTKQQLPKICNS